MSEKTEDNNRETNPGGTLRTRGDLHDKFKTGLRPVQEDFFDIFETLLSREGEDGITSNFSYFDTNGDKEHEGLVSPLVIAPDFDQDRFEPDEGEDAVEKIPLVIQADMNAADDEGKSFVQRMGALHEDTDNHLDLFASFEEEENASWQWIQTIAGNENTSSLGLSIKGNVASVNVGTDEAETSLNVSGDASITGVATIKRNGAALRFVPPPNKEGYRAPYIEFCTKDYSEFFGGRGGYLGFSNDAYNNFCFNNSCGGDFVFDCCYPDASNDPKWETLMQLSNPGGEGDNVTLNLYGKLDAEDTLLANQLSLKNDGSKSQGIRIWDDSEDKWGIYMTAQGAKSMDETNPVKPTGDVSSYAMRLRVCKDENQGLIVENSANTPLFSIRGQDANTWFGGSVQIGDSDNLANLDVYGSHGMLKLRNHDAEKKNYCMMYFYTYGSGDDKTWMGYNGTDTFQFSNQIGSKFAFNEHVHFGGGIDVTGAGSFSGLLSANGCLNVAGTPPANGYHLNVGGTGYFKDKLTVASNGLDVTGNGSVSNNLSVGSLGMTNDGKYAEGIRFWKSDNNWWGIYMTSPYLDGAILGYPDTKAEPVQNINSYSLRMRVADDDNQGFIIEGFAPPSSTKNPTINPLFSMKGSSGNTWFKGAVTTSELDVSENVSISKDYSIFNKAMTLGWDGDRPNADYILDLKGNSRFVGDFHVANESNNKISLTGSDGGAVFGGMVNANKGLTVSNGPLTANGLFHAYGSLLVSGEYDGKATLFSFDQVDVCLKVNSRITNPSKETSNSAYRALVHGNKNQTSCLILNYNRDYAGGITLNGPVNITCLNSVPDAASMNYCSVTFYMDDGKNLHVAMKDSDGNFKTHSLKDW